MIAVSSMLCQNCAAQGTGVRTKPNRLLLPAATPGVWLVVWAMTAWNPDAWRCTHCGVPSGMVIPAARPQLQARSILPEPGAEMRYRCAWCGRVGSYG